MSTDTADASTAIDTAQTPWGAIALLSLASFASAASLRVTDPLLPELSRQFSATLASAAQVITFFSVAYGVLQAVFGPLGDRYGKYRVIGWACAGSAVSSLLCALATDLHTLTLARMAAGASAAAIIPLSMAWIGDQVPYERRQPVLARFLTGQIIGFSGGQLMGGLAAEYANWRAPFYALAIWFAVMALLLMRQRRRQDAGKAPAPAAHALRTNLPEQLLSVLRRPWARVVIVTVFLEGAVLYGPFAFAASHIHLRHGVSLGVAGGLLMLFGAGGLMFAAFSGRIVRALGESRLAMAGGIVLAASIAIIAAAPTWQWTAPGCLLAGLGFYMLHNTLQINATQMAPEQRGAAVSLFASSFFLGQSTGVAVAGFWVVIAGTTPVLLASAALLPFIAAGFAWLRKHRPQF
jgi:predicted MFS family arabinose efflux permease